MFTEDKNKGFTLIEVLVALSIFTIGIVAAFGLALYTSNNSVKNSNRVIATNLAREGLELVRNVRDSNWLRIDANELGCGGLTCSWDYGLNQNTDYIYIDYNDNNETDWGGLLDQSYSCGLGSLEVCTVNCLGCRLYQNSDGFYDHNNSGVATNLRRVIQLRKICSEDSSGVPDPADDYEINMGTQCDVGDSYIGIGATAYVQWERDEDVDGVSLTDKIYNWRR